MFTRPIIVILLILIFSEIKDINQKLEEGYEQIFEYEVKN